MTRKLIRSGNSDVLTIDKTMKEHLGIANEVDVQYQRGKIVLRKPLSVREASKRSAKKFGEAYKRLAE